MDISNGDIDSSFARTVQQHNEVQYAKGKWLARLYNEDGQWDPAGSTHKYHYHVASAPNYSMVEEVDELPVNFSRRPHGRGQHASSFIARSPGKSGKKRSGLNTSCGPEVDATIVNRPYLKDYLGTSGLNRSGHVSPKKMSPQKMSPQKMSPQKMVPARNNSASSGFASSLRSKLQFDQSFESEPSDSDDTEDGVLNTSHKFADEFPEPPFQIDDGLRTYNPDYQKEFIEARDWISDNMSRGAFPSEMVGEEEVARNLAENSFNDSILSIHNVSRDNYNVNPSDNSTSFKNSLDETSSFNPLGGNRSHDSNGSSSLNTTAGSQPDSSWIRNKDAIIQQLHFGDGSEPTLANRTHPVPSKSLKGLYKPLARRNQPQHVNKSYDLDFGDISAIPPPSPYKSVVPDPRTSTPVKSQANKSSLSPLSISTIGNASQSSFLSSLDSANFSRLNKAIRGDSSSETGSAVNKSADQSSKEDVDSSRHIASFEETDQSIDTQKELTVNPGESGTSLEQTAETSSAQAPANSKEGSPAFSNKYELDSSELICKLSETLPSKTKDKESVAERLNKSVGDQPNIDSDKHVKRKLDFKGNNFVPFSAPDNSVITLSDSGYGVSIHTNGCDCSSEEMALSQNRCVELNESGLTLKIVTESDVQRPPCCKDTEAKLNYVSGVNAKKVAALTKEVRRKNRQFQDMLTENLKLSQKNYHLKSKLQQSNLEYIRKRTFTNKLEARNNSLQEKLDLVQNRIEFLEFENLGKERESQHTDRVISKLTINYDKMLELHSRQDGEIQDLNQQIDELNTANNNMAATLREMNVSFEMNERESSQLDSTFASVAADNSILTDECDNYQAELSKLEVSLKALQSKIQALSITNEQLASKNRDLSLLIDRLESGYVPAEQIKPAMSPNTDVDNGLHKIVDFYKKFSDDLHSQVQEKDKRISELETSIHNNSTRISSMENTTSMDDAKHTSSENSLFERTVDLGELKQFQDKYSAAKLDVIGLKNLLRDARVVIKGLSVNPAKFSDPSVATKLGGIYKELQKADNEDWAIAETSLDKSVLERTTDLDSVNQIGTNIRSARSEVQALKALLHHAKDIMKELAENPAKSSDPKFLSTFDIIYKQFKKVTGRKVSFN